jgi:hypothetical protein
MAFDARSAAMPTIAATGATQRAWDFVPWRMISSVPDSRRRLAERFAWRRVTNQMVIIISRMKPDTPPMIDAGAAWKRNNRSPPRFQMDSRNSSRPRV